MTVEEKKKDVNKDTMETKQLQLVMNLEKKLSEYDKKISKKCCESYRLIVYKVFEEVVKQENEDFAGSKKTSKEKVILNIVFVAVRHIFPPKNLFSPLTLPPNVATFPNLAKPKLRRKSKEECESEKFHVKKLVKKEYRKHKLDFDCPKDEAIFAKLCFGLVQLV